MIIHDGSPNKPRIIFDERMGAVRRQQGRGTVVHGEAWAENLANLFSSVTHRISLIAVDFYQEFLESLSICN